jgi:nucleoside 2-deoxyribosyltransferase
MNTQPKSEKLFAFVLMPFDSNFEDVYSLGIKDAVEKAGMFAERVDEQVFHREGILERIYNQIDLADLIIADMTGRNPNVFYEVGYAHAKNKLCILLTKNANDIPFDLKHHRHLVYKSVADLRSKISSDLDYIKTALAEREIPIKVTLGSISGDLEKTKYYATAKVTIALDMHNRTNSPSPEIDAVYFYTGKGWRFTQDKQECQATDSDVRDFTSRHFVKSPVSRVGKDGWAPIKIIGEKIVGTAWRGETLQDSYDLTGFALVKVKTARGDFDSRVDLKVTADHIPF